MKTLHLNLKKKWYDMILSGEKKEEYREIKHYWLMRLFIFNAIVWDEITTYETDEIINDMKEPYMRHKDANDLMKFFCIIARNFDQIIFSNGYHKNRRQFKIECFGIYLKCGYKKWGAVPSKYYFVIKLGEIIK